MLAPLSLPVPSMYAAMAGTETVPSDPRIPLTGLSLTAIWVTLGKTCWNNCMKDIALKLFSPLLKRFNTDETPAGYRPSHRKILLAVGSLFMLLSVMSVCFAALAGSPGALIPILFFFAVSTVCVVIGWLGNDGAVAKIWGTK